MSNENLSTFKGLEVIRQQFEEYNQKFIIEAKEKFTESFKEVFETYPEILSIKWQQYTPYFNDGDECTFGVYEPTFLIGDKAIEGCIGKWDIEADKELEQLTYLNPTLKTISSTITSTSFEEVLQEMFGNHTEVTITKKGIQVDEYDHD